MALASFGVFDGRLVEVEEVDCALDGRGLGFSEPSSPALAPSLRRAGGQGLLAGRWTLGWAWCWEALAPLRRDFPGVFSASVGLALWDDATDGLGAVDF